MNEENQNKSVLIVEDDESLRDVLKDKFESSGFAVFEAKNGIEGLEEIEKNNPDLVILDIVMPKMDGIEMLKKLKQKEKEKNIPVVLLTNISDTDKINEAISLGVKDYMLKAEWKLKDIVIKAQEVMSTC